MFFVVVFFNKNIVPLQTEQINNTVALKLMGTAASGMDESAVLSRTRQNNFTVLVRLHSDFILRHEKLPLTQRFQHVGGCRETEAHQKLLFTSRVALQDGIDHV